MDELETTRSGTTVLVQGSSRDGILDAVTRALDGAVTELVMQKYTPAWDEVSISTEVRKIEERTLVGTGTVTTLTAVSVELLGVRQKRDIGPATRMESKQ